MMARSPSVSPHLFPPDSVRLFFSCLPDPIRIGRSSYSLHRFFFGSSSSHHFLLPLSLPERSIHLLRAFNFYERRVFRQQHHFLVGQHAAVIQPNKKRARHLMMAMTGVLVVLARQLFIYSLLIVANESKRIEKIPQRNQDGERLLRLRKHSCVSSSRAGHLGGALPGLFADHHQQQDGCDHDHGPAPSFSAPQNGSTVKGHHGAPAQLHCNIQDLHHRAVSWIRKTENDLQLLTVGESSHTADPRINPEFIYPHLWQLKFNPAMINDSGTYLCHISTDPPLIRYIHLEISVPEPIVEIVDSQTDAAVSSDRVLYYRIGSSLELRCRVRHYWIKPKIFQWLKSGTPVADELWRGGISIYTEITKPGQLENKLSIANATINDGGNYTCSLDSFSFSIVVHFLKEEKQAASQHATNGGRLSLALHSLHQGLVRHLLLSFLLQIVIVHQHHHLFRVVR